jgi:hypothetical protein
VRMRRYCRGGKRLSQFAEPLLGMLLAHPPPAGAVSGSASAFLTLA